MENDLIARLKALYASYRNAPTLEEKGQYFAPDCLQICRPNPSFSATGRDTIVRYLGEAAETWKDLITTSADKQSHYTVRTLDTEESADFGADENVRPVGFSSAAELRDKALQQGWVGLRIDLWDVDGQGRGMLVKVQYWWGKDAQDSEWRQVLHDILYIGHLDGTEGSQGTLIE
jgi:hypothetical protein